MNSKEISKNWDKHANKWDSLFLKIFFDIIHRNSIKLIKEHLRGKILDIGCATGNFLSKIQKINKNLDLYGIDSSKKMIDIAKSKFKNIKFYNLSAEDIDFPSNYFDVITIIETFHHLQDQNIVLEKISKILKQDGILLISEPNIDNKIINLLVKFFKNFSIEKETKFLTKEEIIKLASNFQLKNIKTTKFLGNIFLLFKKT
jgi:ubiquinone/menaquinone biosynthesis C-methylase UbiE